MIISTRWRKLSHDFDAITGRIIIAVAAIGLGIFAVALIGTAYSILTREVSRNYLATNPASAIIDFGAVDPKLVETVRRNPVVSDVEATSIVKARIELHRDEWVPLLLFVIPDFKEMHQQGLAPDR